MRILLYNPDNGVTRNFMPHLWMFLLKALTPPGHEVLLIDGNAKPLNDRELVRYIKEENIGLVGIGAMTRMVQKAYRVADVVRAAGIPVVMGGPHVTEEPDEALGKDGGQRHADAVALGEADETWPQIVEDAARGQLKEIYEPVDEAGKEKKPSLQPYPVIPWDTINLDQFNFVPKIVRRLTERYGSGVSYFNTIPMESGRKWVFIGMESIDPANLAGVNKSFNKPGEYAAVLNRLAQRNIYAITSFIFGLDNDTPGVADRTLEQIESWPPGMPVFSPLVPLPGTPTYKKLGAEGRLTRPKHWLNFAHNKMAHIPKKMTIEEAQVELDKAWLASYSPERNQEAIDWFKGRDINDQIMHFVMRMFFRGIYFPQRNARVWTKLVAQNRKPILRLVKDGYGKYREARKSSAAVPAAT